MHLQLVDNKDEILHSAASPYSFSENVGKRYDPYWLVQSMDSVMRSYGGIGLAAPQVGLSFRMFVMRSGNKTIGVFNPTIISSSNEKSLESEGCLSYPGLSLKVNRHEMVVVKFTDINGAEIEAELSGIDARCFQHEIDHLDGFCIVDRAAKLSVKMAMDKLRKRSR